jgi:hypothetical protein
MIRVLNVLIINMVLFTMGYSQFLPYKPLEFTETNPDWQVVMQDFNIEDSILYDGYNHFTFSDVAIHNILIKDNVAFIPYHVSKEYYIEGFHSFAIDLASGAIKWNKIVDLRSNEKQEFLISHEIIDDANYSLLSARRIKYPGNDFFPSNFALFGDTSLLATRSYNLLSGSLVDSLISDTSLPTKAKIKHSINNESSLYINNDNIIYIESNVQGDMILHETIDNEGTLTNNDTLHINFKNDYGNQSVSNNAGNSNIHQINEDSIYILRFGYSETSDDRELGIRIFDSEFEEIGCIDLLANNNLPSFRNIGIESISWQHIFLSVKTSDEFGFDQSEKWIFNHSGDLELRIPQVINGSTYVSKAVTYDNLLGDFVLFAFNDDSRNIDVFQSEDKSLILKHTFEIEDKDLFPNIHNITVLDNDRYLINFSIKNINDVDNNQKWESLMIFSDVYSKFGLTTSIVDLSDDENSVVVFPNPSNGLINVEGCEFCDYKVHSSDGKLYRSGQVENQTVYIEDKGIYIISFQKENRTMSKLVIVE